MGWPPLDSEPRLPPPRTLRLPPPEPLTVWGHGPGPSGQPIETSRHSRARHSSKLGGDALRASRILGIDPGSAATGFGIVERRDGVLVHVAHGVLRLPRTASPAERLDRLYCALREVIELHRPDAAGIEQVFVARGARSALVLGQARGVAMAALGSAGLPVGEYAPARIKASVTGNGRASKIQVQQVVCRVLALGKAPPTDAADALAAAICHAQAGRLEALGVRSRPSSRRARAAGPVIRVRRSR